LINVYNEFFLFCARSKDVDLNPHRVRGWLDAKPDPQFAEKCHDICQTYRPAPERATAGIPTFSIDEMTGIQALERIAPTLPVRPGRVERREFEYTRHGTCTLIASFNVATGAASADIGETRTEEDFAAHLVAPVQQPRIAPGDGQPQHPLLRVGGPPGGRAHRL